MRIYMSNKVYLLCFLNIFTLQIIPSESTPCSKNIPDVHVHTTIYNANKAEAESQANPIIKQTQEQKLEQHQQMNVCMTVMHKIDLTLPNIDYAKLSAPVCSLQNMLAANTTNIATATLATAYAYMLYRIKQTESLIQQNDAWCNWKAIIPMAHLILTPAPDLWQQLNLDIHKKYALQGKESLFEKATDIFLQDIRYELNLLNTYEQWYNITRKFWCNKFFLFQYNMNIISEKKTRILFILDLFMAKHAQDHHAE